MSSHSADQRPPVTDAQPLRDRDTSIEPDPTLDEAQREWDLTTALDQGAEPDDPTATGDDPAQLPADDDEVPSSDLPGADDQPETQGTDPVDTVIGEDGQGDLAPEDL
jgi:hypothetical protein